MNTKTFLKKIFLSCRNINRCDFSSLFPDAEKVSTTAFDGAVLRGTFVPAERPQRIIIAMHSHGSDTFSDFGSISPFLKESGASVIYADLRAHGESEGEIPTLGIRERKDFISWLNFASEKISPSLPVYFYGKEAGALSAIMVYGTKLTSQVHGIIADTPFSSPDKLILHKIKQLGEKADLVTKTDRLLMKNYGFSLFDYSAEESFRSLSRPVLFLCPQDAENDCKTAVKQLFDICPCHKEECFYSDIASLENVLSRFWKNTDNLKFTDEIHLHYPDKTMFQLVQEATERLPDDAAYNFEGKITTYREMLERIETTAKAFIAQGIKSDDVVTLCMPNIPQAIDCFYALNRIGAVASFIHPLSAVNEISYYLNISDSKAVVVPDLFYENVMSALQNVLHPVKVIVARIQHELPLHLHLLYVLKKGRSYIKFPDERGGMRWSDFIDSADKTKSLPPVNFERNKTAVILYSGGTTGISKGICLTDMNFNALAIQARISMDCEFSRGLRNLSAMPIFHGFGLGIGIHTVLINNACCILLAQFNTKIYAAAMKKRKPNFIAGVPTIFRMLAECKDLENEDLSYLQGMFSGGDSMPVELKKSVDDFLRNHNADIQVREGYGLTECVTASCLTPKSTHKEGSIGLPFPDTLYKIVSLETGEEVPLGTDGEIIISGPTVMKGYLNNEEETKAVLRRRSDGRIWLHTGDMGYIDSDGYVWFRQRIKRMIVTSGYNVFPSQVEKIIETHPAVDYCCVIGVKDDYRIEKIKAFVVTKDPSMQTGDLAEDIRTHCKKQIAAYAVPKEIEFRKELPKTLVGKVAYRKLEDKQ